VTTWGPLFAFLSACTWSVGSAYYSRFSRTYRPSDVNFTRALFALPFFIIAAFVTSGGLSEGVEAYRALNSTNGSWLLLSVIASYAVGDVLFLLSTMSLGVPGALAIASGYPILTALISIFFEGETLHAGQWAGLALAVGGIILVILNDPKGGRSVLTEGTVHPLIQKKGVGVVLALMTAIARAANGYSVMKGGRDLN
jgi:drug/metabolite transporter (DMT)-like permease